MNYQVMILRSKKSLILPILLQVVAVAIITLGSLINFHQYKIWGKPLIPNFIGYKRDVEKNTRTFACEKMSGNSGSDSAAGASFDALITGEQIPAPFHRIVSGYILSDAPAPPVPILATGGLRGPPTV